MLLIVPLLVTGLFGGTSILAHSHHGHAVHWHIAASPRVALQVAARHISHHEARAEHACGDCHDDHGHGPADGGDGAPSDEPVDGTLVTLPDYDQAATRGGASVLAAAMALCDVVVWVPACVLWSTGATDAEPGWRCFSTARHLCALTGRDRLVATSQALRI